MLKQLVSRRSAPSREISVFVSCYHAAPFATRRVIFAKLPVREIKQAVDSDNHLEPSNRDLEENFRFWPIVALD